MNDTNEIFLPLLLTVAGISLLVFRAKLREKAMRNLAQEFCLKFISAQSPRGTNHIQGIVNGHNIHVYDYFWWVPDWSQHYTVIEIDGKYIKGNEYHKSFKFGALYYTSIYTLRGILTNIENGNLAAMNFSDV